MTTFFLIGFLLAPVNCYLIGIVGSDRTRVARHYVRTVTLIAWLGVIVMWLMENK